MNKDRKKDKPGDPEVKVVARNRRAKHDYNIEETVEEALDRHGPESTLCVLPQGPQTIPYVQG